MPRLFLPFALLALAAASSAQTVKLTASSTRGYTISRGSGNPSFSFVAPLDTALVGNTTYVWFAEFALPATPSGMTLASATFTSTATYLTSPPPRIGISIYPGTGTIVAPPYDPTSHSYPAPPSSSYVGGDVRSSNRYDVTGGVRKVSIDKPSYLEFRLEPGFHSPSASWYSPAYLTLTYAPQAVPEPAALLPLGLGALALLRRRRA